jgi:hypothetical protein
LPGKVAEARRIEQPGRTQTLRVVTIIDNVPIKIIDAQRQRGSLLKERSVPLLIRGTEQSCSLGQQRRCQPFFAALDEFDRELIIERTKAGMDAARARNCGRPYYKMAPASCAWPRLP